MDFVFFCFWTPCSHKWTFFSEKRSRKFPGHPGDGNETRPRYNMHSSFQSWASRSRQTNNLSLAYSVFLTWIKYGMMSMRASQEGQTADVTRSCYHAFYPLWKHGFIVSEGLWLLSWNFQNGFSALITLKVMKDGYSLCHMSLSQWFFL